MPIAPIVHPPMNRARLDKSLNPSACGKTRAGAPPLLRGSRLTTTLTCGGLQSAETISSIAAAAR